MNKKAWYWIVVIIIVLVIIMATSSHKSSSGPSATASGVRQSMHDLIASGATKTCTFSIPAAATTSSMSGTVYMASQNMRGDFVITASSGKVTNGHMIITGGTDYLWSDAASRGVKLPWSLAASSTALSSKMGVDVNQPASYSCVDTAPAQSEFTLPTAVQFINVSAYIK